MIIRLALLLAAFLPALPAVAQTAGFVAMLGADTVQVERFVRHGNRLDGVVAMRVPSTRIIRYSLTLADNGELLHYQAETVRSDGTPIRTNGAAGSMTFTRDTIIRETLQDGVMTSLHLAAPFSAVPSPSIPYLGVSYVMYEFAFAAARRRSAGASEAAIFQLTMLPNQAAPFRTPVWFVGPDSAEASYFGLARSGYKFDAQGQLLRADWTGTTYRYRINRVSDIDVDAIAQRWNAADLRGAGIGALSPRDTARAVVGAAAIIIEYSRPAKRGRVVWGDVVPWDKVWRLGADMATQITTPSDLRIGAAQVPAGKYSLWLLPSERGESMLVVSRDAPVWGTSYNPAHDLARVPVKRASGQPSVERLTIAIEDGSLWIRWDTVAWSVAVANEGTQR